MLACFKASIKYPFPLLKSRMIKFLYSKGHSENWTVYLVEVDIFNWSIHSSL